MLDPAAVQHAVATAPERNGRLDAVIMTAQVMAYGRIDEIPQEFYELVVDVALHGTANIARTVLPVFVAGITARSSSSTPCSEKSPFRGSAATSPPSGANSGSSDPPTRDPARRGRAGVPRFARRRRHPHLPAGSQSRRPSRTRPTGGHQPRPSRRCRCALSDPSPPPRRGWTGKSTYRPGLSPGACALRPSSRAAGRHRRLPRPRRL
ncbi:MAG: hypothetical protein INR67_12715 [Jatrophihabitans endophyticus]|nr:hypothetical protein [Jatrophihabitans endophyticus]